jgi:hypothetical protein
MTSPFGQLAATLAWPPDGSHIPSGRMICLDVDSILCTKCDLRMPASGRGKEGGSRRVDRANTYLRGISVAVEAYGSPAEATTR